MTRSNTGKEVYLLFTHIDSKDRVGVGEEANSSNDHNPRVFLEFCSFKSMYDIGATVLLLIYVSIAAFSVLYPPTIRYIH